MKAYLIEGKVGNQSWSVKSFMVKDKAERYRDICQEQADQIRKTRMDLGKDFSTTEDCFVWLPLTDVEKKIEQADPQFYITNKKIVYTVREVQVWGTRK